LITNTEVLAYSIDRFAELTGLSVSTVKREIYAGKLKAVKPRGRVLIPVESAREYLGLKEEARESSESLATTA
jgi:excisionase family DNA binding protein